MQERCWEAAAGNGVLPLKVAISREELGLLSDQGIRKGSKAPQPRPFWQMLNIQRTMQGQQTETVGMPPLSVYKPHEWRAPWLNPARATGACLLCFWKEQSPDCPQALDFQDIAFFIEVISALTSSRGGVMLWG